MREYHSVPLQVSAGRIHEKTYFTVQKNIKIIYILEGSVNIQFACGSEALDQGDIEIVNVNEPVRLFSEVDNQVVFIEIDHSFSQKIVHNIDLIRFNCNFSYIIPVKVDDSKIAQLRLFIYEILALYCTRNHPDESVLSIHAEQLLHILMEHFNGFYTTLFKLPNADIHLPRYNNIYEYIMNNLGAKIRLQDIVKQEYVSLQYLSKDFKDKFGISFYKYLSYQRIIRSVRLLLTTKKTIADIAVECGFSAPRYYNKYFKQYLGVSPSEFRLTLLNQLQEMDEYEPLDVKKMWLAHTSNQYNTHENVAYRIAVILYPKQKWILEVLQSEWNLIFDIPPTIIPIYYSGMADDRVESIRQQSSLDAVLLLGGIQLCFDALPVLSMWTCIRTVNQFGTHTPWRLRVNRTDEQSIAEQTTTVPMDIIIDVHTVANIKHQLIQDCSPFPNPLLYIEDDVIASLIKDKLDHFKITQGIKESALLIQAMLRDDWNQCN